jgi:hypothetical protein
MAGQGREPPFTARRVPVQDDDGLGKPKFSIPKFEGTPNVESHLGAQDGETLALA